MPVVSVLCNFKLTQGKPVHHTTSLRLQQARFLLDQSASNCAMTILILLSFVFHDFCSFSPFPQQPYIVQRINDIIGPIRALFSTSMKLGTVTLQGIGIKLRLGGIWNKPYFQDGRHFKNGRQKLVWEHLSTLVEWSRNHIIMWNLEERCLNILGTI